MICGEKIIMKMFFGSSSHLYSVGCGTLEQREMQNPSMPWLAWLKLVISLFFSRIDFESKLSAMGFEMSSATNGKVATLDLTPQRQRDYAARAATSNHKSTPVSIKVTEKKITTTTFNDVEKTTATTTKTKAPAPPVPGSQKRQAPAAPGGQSIYNIIKQKTGTTPATRTPVTTPSVQQRARPAPADSRRDSFDSDESSFESEAYDESEPESEQYGISRQNSQASTQSESSQPSQYGSVWIYI